MGSLADATESTDLVSLAVSHKGSLFSLSLLPDSTLEALQIQLEQLTSVPPPLQKLLYKGKKNIRQEDLGSVTLKGAGLKNGTKITMLGSTEGELGAMQKAIDDKTRKEDIIAKRVGGKLRSTPSRTTPSSLSVPSSSPYKFHNIVPLSHLPSPSTAHALLSRLASDTAILHVMHKHEFVVGTLTELAPHEHPGLLGLNENKGQAIRLRIRTDAYDGFRLYSDIRKVLCHELAHNVWGEHGEEVTLFRCSKLSTPSSTAKVAEFERSVQSNTHSLGAGGPSYAPDPSLEASAYTHILGSSSPTPAGDSRDERRRLALEAAVKRLEREEEELEVSCGTVKGAGSRIQPEA